MPRCLRLYSTQPTGILIWFAMEIVYLRMQFFLPFIDSYRNTGALARSVKISSAEVTSILRL